jgi:hypothetical protein
MARRVLLILIVFALIIAPSLAVSTKAQTQEARGPSYIFKTIDVTTLDGLSGGTRLHDINDRGEIVGVLDTAEGPHGFLIERDGGVTAIQCPGARATVPKGINDHGEISGFLLDADFLHHAFLRSRDGQCLTIDFPDATLTEGDKINNRGQLVGIYRDHDDAHHGFLWHHDSFLTVDVPSDGVFIFVTDTFLRGINTHGEIVGSFVDDFGHAHAFFDDDGTFSVFDIADDTGARDINNRGDIVGIYSGGDGIPHSFILAKRALTGINFPDFTEINFPDSVNTVVSGINNRGEIVGQYSDSSLQPHGFVAIPRGRKRP